MFGQPNTNNAFAAFDEAVAEVSNEETVVEDNASDTAEVEDDVVEVSQQEAKVEDAVVEYKVISYREYLDIMGSSQLVVLNWLLDNAEYGVVEATIAQIAEKSGVSTGTVIAVLRKLQYADVLVKSRNGVYTFNVRVE